MTCDRQRIDNYGVQPRCEREATHVMHFDGTGLNYTPSDEYLCSPHAAVARRELKSNPFATLEKLATNQ